VHTVVHCDRHVHRPCCRCALLATVLKKKGLPEEKEGLFTPENKPSSQEKQEP